MTKFPVQRISLKSHGHSTLGGRKIWFDPDVNRINYEEHGRFLGEFNDDESILVVLDNGEFYLTNIDVNNHYESNIVRIEKFDETKVWTAVLYDADNKGYPYIKRFLMEAVKKHQNYLGENVNSKSILLSDQVYPRIQITFGGNDAHRQPMEIDVEEFIGVKGFKAHGKRLTTWETEKIEELEPTRFPEPEPEPEDDENAESLEDSEAQEVEKNAEKLEMPQKPKELPPLSERGMSEQRIRDEMEGQLNLFPDE